LNLGSIEILLLYYPEIFLQIYVEITCSRPAYPLFLTPIFPQLLHCLLNNAPFTLTLLRGFPTLLLTSASHLYFSFAKRILENKLWPCKHSISCGANSTFSSKFCRRQIQDPSQLSIRRMETLWKAPSWRLQVPETVQKITSNKKKMFFHTTFYIIILYAYIFNASNKHRSTYKEILGL
jgi:hypothetical protein